MIARIIEYSARNRFIIFLMVIFLIAWGYWTLKNTPLDAIPDLSDTQVIIYTEWPGRSPDLVEDQITYPIKERKRGQIFHIDNLALFALLLDTDPAMVSP